MCKVPRVINYSFDYVLLLPPPQLADLMNDVVLMVKAPEAQEAEGDCNYGWSEDDKYKCIMFHERGNIIKPRT